MAMQQYSSHSRRSVPAWNLVLAAAVYAMSHVISRGGAGSRARLIAEVQDSAVLACDGDGSGRGLEEGRWVSQEPGGARAKPGLGQASAPDTVPPGYGLGNGSRPVS